MKKSTRIISAILTVLLLASTFNGFVFAIDEDPTVAVVSTKEDLIAALGNNDVKTIKLADDIVLNDATYTYADGYVYVKDGDGEQIAKVDIKTRNVDDGSLDSLYEWNPVNLTGKTFDGQNNKIIGLYMTGDAFFGTVDVNSKIMNVDFENSFVIQTSSAAADRYTATVVQQLYGDMENVNVKGAVITSSDIYTNTTMTGGVLARTLSTSETQHEIHCPLVKNVTFDGDVVVAHKSTLQVDAGGIVGQIFGGKLLNCINYGNVTVLSGKTYAAGGVVGLVEATAGQITGSAPIESKPIGNNYVLNCANYGTVTNSIDTDSRAAGGVVGFCNPCWSANSTTQLINLYNCGKVANISGTAQNGINGAVAAVNAAGKAAADSKLAYLYCDKEAYTGAKVGGTHASLNPDTATIKTSAACTAMYNLNSNANNIDGACAWEFKDGRLAPALGKAPYTPDESEQYSFVPTYDPETEIAMVSAKVINQTTVEVKFSEPVKVLSKSTSCWISFRFCTVDSTGTTSNAKSGSTVLQVGVTDTFKLTDGSDTATVTSSNLVKILEDRNWDGVDTSSYVLTFSIEGKAYGSNVKGYIDGITSVDGKKMLKASSGKADTTNGKTDGAYVYLNNPYEGNTELWDVPAHGEDDLVLTGAELVEARKLKLNFTYPVKLASRTPFKGIRYRTPEDIASSNYKPGYSKNAAEELLQYTGSLQIEDGVAYFVTTYDLLPVLQGKGAPGGAKPDEDKTYVPILCLEGLELTGEGETNTVGYVDNIQSADGTKRLLASPSMQSAGGIYDGAYVKLEVPEEYKDLTAVYAPKAVVEELTYNGEEQTGVKEADGYTLENNAKTDAGNYTATATLEEGYIWSDLTTEPVDIEWSIAPAEVTVKADDKEMYVGGDIPELTYELVDGELAEGDSFEVELYTDADPETADEYGITQGSLEVVDSDGNIVTNNYNINFTDGTLTVKEKTQGYVDYEGNFTEHGNGFVGNDADGIIDYTVYYQREGELTTSALMDFVSEGLETIELCGGNLNYDNKIDATISVIQDSTIRGDAFTADVLRETEIASEVTVTVDLESLEFTDDHIVLGGGAFAFHNRGGDNSFSLQDEAFEITAMSLDVMNGDAVVNCTLNVNIIHVAAQASLTLSQYVEADVILLEPDAVLDAYGVGITGGITSAGSTIITEDEIVICNEVTITTGGAQKNLLLGGTLAFGEGIYLDADTLEAMDAIDVDETFWLFGVAEGEEIYYTGETGEAFETVFNKTDSGDSYTLKGNFEIVFDETEGFGFKKVQSTIEVPVINGDVDNIFVYTGNPITALTETEFYTVEDAVETAPGKYIAKVTPKDGCKWEDEDFDGEIEWYIVNIEYYLTQAPTTTECGAYNQRAYFLDDNGIKQVVKDNIIDGGAVCTFEQWYLRTMVQYKDTHGGEGIDIRFVSMLNGECFDGDKLQNYASAGFDISINETACGSIDVVDAYTQFWAGDKIVDISDYSDNLSISGMTDFFFLANMEFAYNADALIEVTPYVTLIDGSKLYGRKASFMLGDLR